jgi:hypothetical protein
MKKPTEPGWWAADIDGQATCILVRHAAGAGQLEGLYWRGHEFDPAYFALESKMDRTCVTWLHPIDLPED